MKELIKTLVQEMVTDPSSVEVEAAETTKGGVYDIRVAKKDMGRLIGKKGKNFVALKTLCEAIGLNKGMSSILINVTEDE